MNKESLLVLFIVMALTVYISSGPLLKVPPTGKEPSTCGNNVQDYGESYLNCEKDVRTTLITNLGCVVAGEDECLYHDSAMRKVALMLLVTISLLAIIRSAYDD